MKRFFKRTLLCLFILLGLAWMYACSLVGVDEQVKIYYETLKIELQQQNYKTNFFVISGRRWKLDNYILTKISGAASQSKHKKGQAIDLIILDINGDGKSDEEDVNIVFQILDKKIIVNKGGIGTYKKSKRFFSRQMIHFDCRGKRARWHR